MSNLSELSEHDVNTMSILDLAVLILQTRAQGMSASELWAEMAKLGRKTKGKTPATTVQAVLYVNIATRRDSPFYRSEGGMFGLVDKLSDEEKGTWIQQHELIMTHYHMKKTGRVTKDEKVVHEVDLSACPSYTAICEKLADSADEVLADLQIRTDAYIANTKKYMKATSRITLEYTKSTIVLPFIRLLGYSVFNPDEVLPNRVARDNRQIDYTIYDEYGYVRFTISCVALNEALDKRHWEELRDTFIGTKNAVALLTNGIEYIIYTVADKTGVLNETPFARFNILDDSDLLLYLFYLSKSNFSLKGIANKALHNAVVDVLISNFKEPSDEFISFIVKKLGAKSTKNIREVCKSAIKEALDTVRKMEDV